ncbi:MAG: hypothetical protein ACI9R3_004876 [Verrucomicrobiales bacterium]|jgi:hypothetical protein
MHQVTRDCVIAWSWTAVAQLTECIRMSDSPSSPTRRRFLTRGSVAAASVGLSDLAFLPTLGKVSAEEAAAAPHRVMLRPEIEPVVRLIEETPRARLIEEIGQRVVAGKLSYQEILAGLQLAGVRNIQPRPVGFKFHAVLVINSAHLASVASPDNERWLPIFWALDNFKSSQHQDVVQGDWTMGPVVERDVPPGHAAVAAFRKAMDNWDEAAADAAVAGLVRNASSAEMFELFAEYGSRDFRDIGHKAIYVANSFRTIESIGWQHAEPVLRSLAYALLAHEGSNPAQRDAEADRSGRENWELAKSIPTDWLAGNRDSERATSILPVLRDGSFSDASRAVAQLLQNKVHPQAVWDVLLGFAGELMMRRADILSLHAITTANAMYYAWRRVQSEPLRKFLLLQNAAFLTMFRRDPEEIAGKERFIDQMQPGKIESDSAIEEIFATISSDKSAAAAKVLAYCKDDPTRAGEVIDTARRYLFLKGNNSHDYKYTAAILEDYSQLAPAIRDRYLAASVFNLRGSGDRENPLVARIRAALG